MIPEQQVHFQRAHASFMFWLGRVACLLIMVLSPAQGGDTARVPQPTRSGSATTYQFNAGWNLISTKLNLIAESQALLLSKGAMTLDANSKTYVNNGNLAASQACWIYCQTAETITLSGTPPENFDFAASLKPGWNLVGPLTDSLLSGDDTIAWDWNGQHFYPTKNLFAGRGYWLYCHISPTLKPYGVFLGINGNEYDKLKDYRVVVIEPSEFSSNQIKQLQTEGKKVYGYLNIGAVEEYRPYFNRFEELFLGVYEDWPDERWVNVADSEWQNFIVNELGKQYSDMGFDGFFLDNADVYYNFETEDIYQGLCEILQALKNYNIKLVINGGDTFVTRCINENKYLFDAVNQETVFTSINFENGTYGAQTEEETTYFKGYLATVKNFGLSAYLLEYAADQTLSQKIDAYCAENGFIWYNAKNMDLK